MLFDMLFLAVFAWAAYKGFTRGFIMQLATLTALILGIYGAIKFSGVVSVFLTEKFDVRGEYLPLIAFAITLIGIVVAIHFLAKLIEKLTEALTLGIVNRLLGVVFSLIKYAFIISALLVVINRIDRKFHVLPENKVNESRLYKPLSMLAPLLFPSLLFNIVPPVNLPQNKDEEIFV
jgi:membrane protein required for colicin V production